MRSFRNPIVLIYHARIGCMVGLIHIVQRK
jgi:hypothetical protein